MDIGQIAAEGVIIACVVAASTFAEIRKDRKNREMSSMEHAGLKEGHAGLKEGHESLSRGQDKLAENVQESKRELAVNIQASQQGIQNVIAEKHNILGENIKQLGYSLQDIRDYTIAEQSAQTAAAKKNIDVNELVAAIKNLASTAATYADGVKILEEKISRRDETIAHLEKRVMDLEEENKRYRHQNLVLQQTLQKQHDQNLETDGPDAWER